jgi:hypothetical protein
MGLVGPFGAGEGAVEKALADVADGRVVGEEAGFVGFGHIWVPGWTVMPDLIRHPPCLSGRPEKKVDPGSSPG